jgi:flagellar biosynthesis/type III secretory pathway protein FliH
LSDAADLGSGKSPRWVPSPLLQGVKETPRFLRAPWDAAHAQSFGPWRVAARTDPTLPLELADPAAAAYPALLAPEVGEASRTAGEATDLPDGADSTVASSSVSAERLRLAQDEAHARGLAEGLAQARDEMAQERAREGELLRHLAIELRALSEDPQRFFEPLRRLALHIAEQLVRGELKASGTAIAQIVRQCLAALDPPATQVVVSLHPEDAAMLEAMAPTFLEGLKLQPESQLSRGSVRLRVQDTALEDLIENRLEALVEPLMLPASRVSESVLLRELSPRTEPTSVPRRGRPVDDTIIDATFMPVREPVRDPMRDPAPRPFADPTDPIDPTSGTS